jgi:hypothetical protein
MAEEGTVVGKQLGRSRRISVFGSLNCGHTPFTHVHLYEKLEIVGPPTLIAEHTAES